MMINIYAAWLGILLGIVAGAISGLFFHEEHWLGGYGSWTRRMIRLAHISFFGLGLLNLGLALTARALGLSDSIGLASWLLLIGAVTMPLVCYLSAFIKPFRHLFFIPVLSVGAAVGLLVWRLFAV
ncbi:MAG: hypothetical protein ABSH28_01640 [Acidobacteriota bacterium]|jgi:hypothetical protein